MSSFDKCQIWTNVTQNLTKKNHHFKLKVPALPDFPTTLVTAVSCCKALITIIIFNFIHHLDVGLFKFGTVTWRVVARDASHNLRLNLHFLPWVYLRSIWNLSLRWFHDADDDDVIHPHPDKLHSLETDKEGVKLWTLKCQILTADAKDNKL